MSHLNLTPGAVPAASGHEPRTRRCCARCKTPYMCGNTSCTCHTPAPNIKPAEQRTPEQIAADWAERHPEQAPRGSLHGLDIARRRRLVAEMTADGHRIREIAVALGISESVVAADRRKNARVAA